VLISDETPIEEHQRDELLERFQIHYHAGAAEDEDEDEDDDELEADHQDPGRED
jgi:hypothetical protein